MEPSYWLVDKDVVLVKEHFNVHHLSYQIKWMAKLPINPKRNFAKKKKKKFSRVCIILYFMDSAVYALFDLQDDNNSSPSIIGIRGKSECSIAGNEHHIEVRRCCHLDVTPTHIFLFLYYVPIIRQVGT